MQPWNILNILSYFDQISGKSTQWKAVPVFDISEDVHLIVLSNSHWI